MTIRTLAEVKDLCPSCAAFHSIGDDLEDEDKNQRQRSASTRTAIAALLTNQTRPIDHVEAAQDLWHPLSGSGGEITREVHTGGLGGISTIKLRGRFPAIFVFKRPGRDASTLRRPREGQWSSACRVRRSLPPPAGDAGLSRTCRRPGPDFMGRLAARFRPPTAVTLRPDHSSEALAQSGFARIPPSHPLGPCAQG